MKQFRYFGLATGFLLGTIILIAAFIILYSYTGCSLKDKPKENLRDKTSAAIEPSVELKTNMRQFWEDHITWTSEDMKMMTNDHLKLTTNEAIQRIKKDYAADIIAYDKVHDEILKMSDMLADGIAQQFPEKFKPTVALSDLR